MMKKLFLPVFLLTATAALHANDCCVEPVVKAEVCCEATAVCCDTTKTTEACCTPAEDCCEEVCCDTKDMCCDDATDCCETPCPEGAEVKTMELTADQEDAVRGMFQDVATTLGHHADTVAFLQSVGVQALNFPLVTNEPAA